jgi:CBS-domain-containing membrane protein
VLEVLAKGRDPGKTTVREIMSTQLVIASASEDYAEALQRMATHGVRRLPVVDDELCVSSGRDASHFAEVSSHAAPEHRPSGS